MHVSKSEKTYFQVGLIPCTESRCVRYGSTSRHNRCVEQGHAHAHNVHMYIPHGKVAHQLTFLCTGQSHAHGNVGMEMDQQRCTCATFREEKSAQNLAHGKLALGRG